MKLKDKIVIVTGADSGIGQATAAVCAREGAHVVIGYHTDKDGAAETERQVKSAGTRAVVVQVDIGQPASVQDLFARTQETLGTPDVLVANAAIALSGIPVAELDDATLEQVLRVDLMGPFFCARSFIHARKQAGRGGRLIFIGSVAGHLPTPESAPYGMAKAGVNSLVRSLSRELTEDKINVNAIAPGLIATPMTQERLDDPEKRDKSMEKIPWHRPGRPEEIAELALFLAADTGDYVTGQTWTMDGGLTMNWGGA